MPSLRYLFFAFMVASSLNAEGFSYDRGLSIQNEDGKNKIALGAFLQTRWLLDDQISDAFPFLFVPRARISLAGNVFKRELAYKFEGEFAPSRVALTDFYVDYSFVAHFLQVRVGRFKTAFARQSLTSDTRLEFVDRARVMHILGSGRDVGVMLHNDPQKPFEWNIGVFNQGLYGRFGASFLGPGQTAEPYSEGDFQGGPARLSVALSALWHAHATEEVPMRVAGGLDSDLKLYGFSNISGVYLGAGDVNFPDAGKLGAFTQVSYMIDDRLQPAFRYGLSDNVVINGMRTTEHEILGGLSVYFYRHAFKLQGDAGAIITRDYVPSETWVFGGATQNLAHRSQVRFQLQLAF